jgi:hypothetical protein
MIFYFSLEILHIHNLKKKEFININVHPINVDYVQYFVVVVKALCKGTFSLH